MQFSSLEQYTGQHICAFYRTEEEVENIVFSYLQGGLKMGQKCISLIHHCKCHEFLNKLDSFIRYDNTHVDIFSVQDSYLKTGNFSPDKIIEFLGSKMAEAIKSGFSFVRVSGDMSWAIDGNLESHLFLEYEARLNWLMPQFPQHTLCLYNINNFRGDILMEVLRVHPRIYFNGIILDNPHYIKPDIYLKNHLSKKVVNN